MRLTEGVEWALHCMWLLAACQSDEAMTTRHLAEFFGLPEAYLAKVLNLLVRAGLLKATSGPRGGFRLARSATEISVAEIVEAVEGRTALFHCSEIRQRGPVPLTGQACEVPCGIANVMEKAESAWWRELSLVRVSELVESSGVQSRQRVEAWLSGLAGAR